MVDSMRKRFGHEAATVSRIPGPLKPRNSAYRKLASMGRSRRVDTMRGGQKLKAPVGDYARVMKTAASERSTVGGVIYFPESRWRLTEKQKSTLQGIAKELRGKPQKIEIRGHTSNRPLPEGSPFEDHWDLAYARCRETREYLVKLGINSKRIRVAVAAANEPRHTGNDPILARENSRVEIFMLIEPAGNPDRPEGNGGEKATGGD
jgi:chemotaxis protein MotB